MNYLLSNFEISKSEKFGSLFFKGACAKMQGECLKVRVLSDHKCFGKYADAIAESNPKVPLESDDFHLIANYNFDSDKLVFQTDIIGYEAAFIWQKDNMFAISDDILALAKSVNKSGYGKVALDESKVREFLFYSLCLFEDTIFTDVYRLPPASIIEIDVENGSRISTSYDQFRMTGKCSDAEEAADRLDKYLDNYFSQHYSEGTKYAIGMSGGLDSRVGAYYAKKHGYDIKPIFIGVKRNKLGIKTNDVKRAEAVNGYFGFEPITYYDPRNVDLRSKVIFDAEGAPNMSSNIHQNMGVLPGFEVLINAMMGGEAFGQLAVRDIDKYSNKQLANAILYRFGGKPRYKTANRTLIRLAKYALPESFAKKHIYTDDSIADELISKEQREQAEKRVLDWVIEQKHLGLDNGNIWHKMFYYRFAVIAKTGYYSTFNNSIASLPTYINAGFVREMLNWDSSLLFGTPIQQALIKKLGDLANFRSQTFAPTINSKPRFRRVKKLMYILERAIRGGAMIYPAWFSKKDISKYKREYILKTEIGKKIQLNNEAWLLGESKWFTVMKIAHIEECINNVDIC